MLSTVEIIAAGSTGAEQITLDIFGQEVQSWSDLGAGADNGSFVTRTYSTSEDVTANDVRLRFSNDLYDPANNIDRNVRVDAIVIDGTRYETEDSSVFSTGTWLPDTGIQPGNPENEYLHANGYFQYSGGSPGNGSTIQIRAAGEEGGERFNLLIDEVAVAAFTTTTANQTFDYQASGNVTADQVRIQFTNDLWDPANNIDRNLTVDFISIDGQTYQTEDASTFSTGTWTPDAGVAPGNPRSETLHANGYFQYADGGPVAQHGEIGFTLNSISIDENAGQINVIVFRANGSDGRVTVDYATDNGSADADDFSAISGTLTFEEGTTGQQLSIPISDDSTVESDETFSILLSNATGGATLGEITSQSVTILDNDEVTQGIIFEDSFEGSSVWTTNPFGTDTATTGMWAAGSPQSTSSGGITLQFDSGHTGSRAMVTGLAAGSSVGTYDIDGGVTSVLSPTINLPAGAEIELFFEYNLAYLDNATNEDYFSVSVVSDGNVTEVYDDHAHPFDQAASWQEVTLDVSNWAGDSIQLLFQAADAADGSLVEAAIDDVQVEVLPNAPGVIEVASTGVNLDESAGTATVTVARHSGRAGVVTVDYETIDGSATTEDYTSVSGTLTFADGQSEASVTVPIIDDSDEEPLESFTFQLLNPGGGAVLGTDNSGTVTIVDNDNATADYLPDLTPIAATLTERLSIDTNEQPGRELLRFSTEVANAGSGPLEIWGGSTSGSSQQVFQRIYQEDGGSRDILAGEFVYHPGHGHIHFEGFATYDLRLIDGSGNIIASGGKTSFCLINIRQPFPDVTADAGVVHGRGGNNCGQIQGISAGYSDVYSASLDDQWIDITNVQDGTYWLEITADPENNILESNENNNVSRVQVTISNGSVST